jgi:hypothetical protein
MARDTDLSLANLISESFTAPAPQPAGPAPASQLEPAAQPKPAPLPDPVPQSGPGPQPGLAESPGRMKPGGLPPAC